MKARILQNILPMLCGIALHQNAGAAFSPYASITITNPTPQASDAFGTAVAAVGDKFVIGAQTAGEA